LESLEKCLAEQGAHKAQDLSRGSNDEESVSSEESGLSENALAEDELEGSLKKPPREISDERELTDDCTKVSNPGAAVNPLNCIVRKRSWGHSGEEVRRSKCTHIIILIHPHLLILISIIRTMVHITLTHPCPPASHVAPHPTWLPPPPPIPTPSPVTAQALGGLLPSKNTHHVVHDIATGEQLHMRYNELTVDPNEAQTDIAEVVYYL
jgi:hypothetical protein